MTRPRPAATTNVPGDAPQTAQDARKGADAMSGASDAARGTTGAARGIVVDLPNPPLQLHPNYSASWQARAMWRKHARQLAMGCAYNVRPPAPFGRCRARADFRFTQIRRRDGDNLQAWLKAYADGLTDAAVWRDDSLVTWEPPTVTVDPQVKPGVVITIWEVEG